MVGSTNAEMTSSWEGGRVTRGMMMRASSGSNDLGGDDSPASSRRKDCAPPYSRTILSELVQKQDSFRPSSEYVCQVCEHAWRSAVVDWVFDFATATGMNAETVHLSVNYLDRFLSVQRVDISRVTLVVAACTSLAAKYEEEVHPPAETYARASDYEFSAKDVVETEGTVMTTLSFRLSPPTSRFFPHALELEAPLLLPHQDFTRCLSRYWCDTLLVNPEALRYSPLSLAGSCLLLACRVTRLLEEDASVRESVLRLCDPSRFPLREVAWMLHSFFTSQTRFEAVRKRYMRPELHFAPSFSVPFHLLFSSSPPSALDLVAPILSPSLYDGPEERKRKRKKERKKESGEKRERSRTHDDSDEEGGSTPTPAPFMTATAFSTRRS